MVIPVYDRNPTRRTPYVTYLLLALNVVVFLMQPISRLSVTGDVDSTAQLCRQEAFFERWGAIPKELVENEPRDETVTGPGPRPNTCVVGEPDYEKVPFLSALTSTFLHGGWLHLLGNMLFLFVFGNNVEDRLGRVRFLLFYLAWGILATYAFAFANSGTEQVVVGASGAIAGVLGAYLMIFPRAKVLSLLPFLFFLPLPLPAWLVLGSWFAIQWAYSEGLLLTEGSNVAYLAHVAGFAAGMVSGLMFRGSSGASRVAHGSRYR